MILLAKNPSLVVSVTCISAALNMFNDMNAPTPRRLLSNAPAVERSVEGTALFSQPVVLVHMYRISDLG